MKTIYLKTNETKDPQERMTKRIAAYLEERGVEVVRTGPIDSRCDCCLVLGGDGSVLRAAHQIGDEKVPILAINLGTLGYLAEIDKSDWQRSLDSVLAGHYYIEERMMLEGRRGSQLVDTALNDVVFSRSGAIRIMNYDVYVGGQFLCSFNADGIILSTPTGSTAYNLSAGGPIVEPHAHMILMTQICPHTLQNRSVILSPEDEIEVVIGRTSVSSNLEAYTSFDGRSGPALFTGQVMSIRRSEKVTRLVRISRRSFLETLNRKMASKE